MKTKEAQILGALTLIAVGLMLVWIWAGKRPAEDAIPGNSPPPGNEPVLPAVPGPGLPVN